MYVNYGSIISHGMLVPIPGIIAIYVYRPIMGIVEDWLLGHCQANNVVTNHELGLQLVVYNGQWASLSQINYCSLYKHDLSIVCSCGMTM